MIIPHVLLHPPREDFIVIYGCSCLLEHICTHSTSRVTLSQHWHQEESPGNFAAVFLENPMRKQIAWWPPFTSMFKPDRCVTYSAVSSTLLIICSGPPLPHHPVCENLCHGRISPLTPISPWTPHFLCFILCLALVYAVHFTRRGRPSPYVLTQTAFLWHSNDTVVVNRWFDQLCVLKGTTEIPFGRILFQEMSCCFITKICLLSSTFIFKLIL